jgi:hypothetical protein
MMVILYTERGGEQVMNNLLLLLVFMGQLKALEPDYHQQVLVSLAKRDSIAPHGSLKGGGGGSGQGGTKHRISVQRLVVPTNPPANSPHIAMAVTHNPSSRCSTTTRRGEVDTNSNISIGMNQNNIEVVNLRGHMEAQNIDIGPNRSWWDRFMECISGWCGSRIRPLSPPRLERQLSYYPGRADIPDAFSSK